MSLAHATPQFAPEFLKPPRRLKASSFLFQFEAQRLDFLEPALCVRLAAAEFAFLVLRRVALLRPSTLQLLQFLLRPFSQVPLQHERRNKQVAIEIPELKKSHP